MSETVDWWSLIHAERTRLVKLLETLESDQWSADTLCSAWSVDEVVAHLSAAANTGRWAWIRSIVAAGFNADRHNSRLLARFRGRSPEEALGIFRTCITATIVPTKDYPAFLGEVIVHSQDIARPLGLTLTPDPSAVLEVARFYAAKDFAVNSRTLVKGLTLVADDADFRVGSGPAVRGRLLVLVMAMAGRPDFASLLEGEGAEELRTRMS